MKKEYLYIGLAILVVGGLYWWKSKGAPKTLPNKGAFNNDPLPPQIPQKDIQNLLIKKAIQDSLPKDEEISSYFKSYSNRVPSTRDQCTINGITYLAQVVAGESFMPVDSTNGQLFNPQITWQPIPNSKINVAGVVYTYKYYTGGMQSSYGTSGRWVSPMEILGSDLPNFQ